MHPMTVYEIAVREHEHATADRARATTVRRRLLARRPSSRTVPSQRPRRSTEGRPAVA